MIRIGLDMDIPEECHECPFQLKFKDGEIDSWYMRRCVITQRKIEYPRPEWCPLKEQEPKTGHWIFESRYCEAWSHTCSECGKRMTTAVGMYASFCWNCGAKMAGGDSSGSEIPNS